MKRYNLPLPLELVFMNWNLKTFAFKLTQALAGFIHDVQGKTIEMIQPNPSK